MHIIKIGYEVLQQNKRVSSTRSYTGTIEEKCLLYNDGWSPSHWRIRRLYPKELEASKEARAALDYLDKRRGNMRYGWLRRNGYCISSSHVEAAARILVARRCKQAGMHWRHHNAACVCAIIARLRSVA